MSRLHVVLGATGAIGSAVVAELTKRGRTVREVARASGTFRADVGTVEGATAACDGAEVVYQCAQPPYARWAAEFPELTRSVLAGVKAAGAKLVMADNLYMYGPVTGPITEDLPYKATGPKGHVRGDVARMILTAHAEGRVRTAIGRASDYYGPGGVNTVLGANIFAAAVAGKTTRWVGDLDQPHSVSYLRDIATGLVTLGEREEADGRAWHLPVAPPVTGREFLLQVWAAAGGRPRSASLGRRMQRVVGLFNPVVRELAETAYQRDRPFVVDDRAFREAFGPVTATEVPDGVKATVEWFRAR